MPGYKTKGKSQVQIQPKSPLGNTKQVPEILKPNSVPASQSETQTSTQNATPARKLSTQQDRSGTGNVDKRVVRDTSLQEKKVKLSKPSKIIEIIEGKEEKQTKIASPLAKLDVELSAKQGQDGDKSLKGPIAGLESRKFDVKNKNLPRDSANQSLRASKLKGRNYANVKPDNLIENLVTGLNTDNNAGKPQSEDGANVPDDKGKDKDSDVTSQTARSTIDNVVRLPLSVKDTFLYQRGINSSYPSIILTSKKSEKSSGTETSDDMMFVSLNTTIKKNVEKIASDLLKTSTRNDSNYLQNVSLMKTYSQLCLDSAASKDDFVKSLNIYNTPLTSINNVIGRIPYTVFDNISTVKDYTRTWAFNYPQDFEKTAPNTQLILQFFKNFYMTYVYGGISFKRSGYPPFTTSIVGESANDANKIINGLKKISQTSTITSTNLLNPNPNFEVSPFDGLNGQSLAAYSIIRDLVVHKAQIELQSIQNGATVNQSLGGLIGVYYPDSISAAADVSGGIANLEDFMQYNRKGKITNIFLRREGSATIGLLDNERSSSSQYNTGIDLLLNNDLLRLSNDPNATVSFQIARSLINDYKNLCVDITNFYNKTKIDPINTTQRGGDEYDTLLNAMQTEILAWINSSKLAEKTGARDSKNGFIRVLMAFRAATSGQEYFALKLFRLMCVNYKLLQPGIPEANRTVLLNEQKAAINSIISTTFTQTETAGPSLTYSSNGGLVTSTGGTVTEFVLDKYSTSNQRVSLVDFKAALSEVGNNTLTRMHAIARNIEYDFSFRENTNFTNCNQKTSSYGLSLNTDARAFVIYKIFLSMLRNTTFSANIALINSSTAKVGDKGADPEKEVIKKWKFSLTYAPMHFRAIKFAFNNMSRSTSNFSDYVKSIAADPNIGVSIVTGDNILEVQKKNVKFYHSYFRRFRDVIWENDRDLYSIVQLLSQHQNKLNLALDRFEQSNIPLVHSFIRDNNIFNSSKLINDVQLEQAKLKSIISRRYETKFRYLPSISDYTFDQIDRIKPCLTNGAKLFPTGKNVQYVVVGLPAGMLENMRYKNLYKTDESLFEIEIICKGLQTIKEDDSIIKSFKYRFSSNLFIDDYSNPKKIKYDKINKVFNSANIVEAIGNRIKIINHDQGQRIYGKEVISNHMVSYYSGLILKALYGLNVEEQVFDLVNREIVFPDPALQSDYFEVFRKFMSVGNYDDTPENKLFIQRVMNDIARSTNFAPQEHFTSGTSTKLFDRVFVIPVNFSNLIDLKFLNVMTKINLLPNSIPRTRSR